MSQTINIDKDGVKYEINTEMHQTIDELRKKMDLGKFWFIDRDGIQIENNFESNFKVSDIYDEITNTIYIKPIHPLYQPQSELLQEMESQKLQIDLLKKQLKEQQDYSKSLEEEIEKIKKLDDQDAKKQQAISIFNNMNKEYISEEEHKGSFEESNMKFFNDKHYFKSLLLSSHQSNIDLKNDVNIKQLDLANKNLELLLYPAPKVRELSYEEKLKKKVEHIVFTVRPRIENDLSLLESMMREMVFVLKHKDEINMNQNLHFYITKEITKKIETSHSNTICLSCNRTCHEDCSQFNDKQECIAIQEDYCNACPKKCFWNQHINTNYRIEYELITQIITFDDLRKVFCQTESDSLQSDSILLGLMKEFLIIKKKIFDDIQNIQQAINKLGDLLNRPNNFSVFEIMESMILHEKTYRKIGFQQRVKGLEEVKSQFMSINGLQGQKREDAIEEHFYNYKQQLIELKLNSINYFLF